MKPNTSVWLQCESIGRPADGLKMHGTTRECILAMSQWIVGVYMGSKIRITLARTESELESRKSSELTDMRAELDSMLEGVGDGPESE